MLSEEIKTEQYVLRVLVFKLRKETKPSGLEFYTQVVRLKRNGETCLSEQVHKAAVVTSGWMKL